MRKPKSPKILRALVPTPDGDRVLCKVIDYDNIFPRIAVRALSGRPFEGSREAIVSQDTNTEWRMQ